jgi:hypothetical protein
MLHPIVGYMKAAFHDEIPNHDRNGGGLLNVAAMDSNFKALRNHVTHSDQNRNTVMEKVECHDGINLMTSSSLTQKETHGIKLL